MENETTDAAAAGAPAASDGAPPDTSRPQPRHASVGMINRILAGRYEILETIGEGGLLASFRARDRAMNRIVAVKTLLPAFAGRADLAERLKAGLGQTLSLTHPNITRTFDVGTDEETGALFLVEEYLRGIDLKERIRRTAPFQLSAATDAAIAITEALEFAHARGGIAHGDVRPQNVLIGPEGQVKLTGFGVAGAQESILNTGDTDHLKRIVGYIAPDAARAAAPTASGDIYAVGVILYEMLTGELPYTGDNPVQIALRHAQDPVPSPRHVNTGVPPALDGIVRKALGKRPEERYASATALLHDLRTVRDALRFGKSLSWSPLEEKARSAAPAATPVAEQTLILEDTQVLPGARVESSPAAAISPAASLAGATAEEQLLTATQGPWSAYANSNPASATGSGLGADPYGNTNPLAPRPTASTAVVMPVVAAEENILEEGRPQRGNGGAGLRWLTFLNLFLVLLILGGVAFLGYSTLNFLQPPNDVTVPNLVGKSLAEAKSIAHGQNFKLAVVDEQYRDKEASEVIFQQQPTPGRHIREGKAISIWVSKGPRMVDVPDVRDMSFEKGRKTLERAGLRLGNYKGEYDPLVPRGNVLRQLPEPGEPRPRGTKIDLVLSKGEEPPPAPLEEPTPLPPPENLNEGAGSAAEARPTPDEGGTSGGSNRQSRVRYFDIRYPVPSDGQSHRVRIDVLDDDGPRTVLDEAHQPGDAVKHRVEAVGSQITIKLYDNDELRSELTK